MKTFIYSLLIIIFNCKITKAQWQPATPLPHDASCFYANDNVLIVGTGGYGIYRSIDNGLNWTLANTGLMNFNILSFASDGQNIYAGTYGGIYKSTNAGLNWSVINTGLSNSVVNGIAISGNYVFAGTNGGVFLSANGGANWVPMDSGLTNLTVTCISADATCIYVGTYGDGVFVSNNNGTSWSQRNVGFNFQFMYMNTFSVDGSITFAGSLDVIGPNVPEIYFTVNNGGNWVSINPGQLGLPIIDNLGQYVIVGVNAYNGVLLSDDFGTTFRLFNDGFIDGGNSISPNVIAITHNSNYLYAVIPSVSTSTNLIVWKRLISDLVAIEEVNKNSKLIICPNPINKTYKITVDEKMLGGEIVVYNFLGWEVKRKNIIDSTIEMERDNLPGGVYFVKIIKEQTSHFKKIILN